MKCRCYVKWEERRKKGAGETYMKAAHVVYWIDPRADGSDPRWPTAEQLLTQGYVVCGGDIKVEVRAEDEPEWGGSFATLVVNTTCQRCGSDHHSLRIGTGGSLGLDTWLNHYEGADTLLTEAVANLPDDWVP